MEDDVLLEKESRGGIDWVEARELSLQPGGFGERRVELWTKLLHIDTPTPSFPASEPVQPTDGTDSQEVEQEQDAHRDERQIQLDTDRSFVLYPVDNMQERVKLQTELHDLIVALFRKRRTLNYFQGYHDIISVFFLTLPPELQLACVEKMSLHRLRDAMGNGLEPVIGLLRLLKRVLALANPEFSELIEQNTPLPYFALSNLLTLFSHDVPTLALIQHVFDYLLSRPPILSVYLAVAVVLTRKEEAERLTQEGEDGMIHSLLSSLPDLYEEGDHTPTIPESTLKQEFFEQKEHISEVKLESHDNVTHNDSANVEEDSTLEVLPNAETEVSTPDNATEGEDSTSEGVPKSNGDLLPEVKDEVVDESSEISRTPSDSLVLETPPPSSSNVKEEDESYPQTPISSITRRPRVSLSALFRHADSLYEQYPPTHPQIDISSIMGPQSVTLTWSEDPSNLPDDDEAEKMVTRPELIVLPYTEEVPESKETEENEDRYGHHEKKRRRKLKKPRRLGALMVQRKTVVASAVIVLGVAMAVYGTGQFRGGFGDHHRPHREWKAFSRFVGAMFLGAGERLLDTFLK
ncbi:GTPase-activating protein TBC20/Gyp8-like protein [Abortiporus biennis]